MASIRKRGNSYQITVSNGRDSSGKQILETVTFTPDTTLTPKKQQEALDKFVFDFEQKVKSGKLLKGEKLTLKEYSDYWLKEYAEKNLEKSTLASYKYPIKQQIVPALGHLKLSKIGPLHLQSFFNNLTEEGVRNDGKNDVYSSSTIQKTYAVLSSMLSKAVQWQLIEYNPCDRVKAPKTQKKSKSVKNFTIEETQVFLEAIERSYPITHKSHNRKDANGNDLPVKEYIQLYKLPTQLIVFFNLAIFSGSRRSELIALTWHDIDFDNGTMSIDKATVSADSEVYTKQPKNETSERFLALPESVMNLLKRYRIEQQEYRLSLGDQWKGDDFVFIQWDGSQMYPDTPYKAFKKFLKRYNSTVENEEDKLPEITLHDLRHTSATLLIADNMDVRTVSNRLGHAQTSTTMNIYATALKKKDEEAANSLEDMLKRKA